MTVKRCNPFIHAPLKLWGMCLMSLSAIVFVSQIVYGMILGLLWTKSGEMPEDRFLRFHEIMQRLLATDLRLHPWLSCQVHNPHGETFERGAIAICNHQSMVDTLCMLILSPRLLMVTNERVGRNPILRRVFKHAGFTTIGNSVEELMAYCKRQTLRGYTVIIFPEGERSADCDIKRFHNGAFHIARELELDILPLYLHGSGHVLPLHRAFQNKGSFYVEIGKRIPPSLDKATDHVNKPSACATTTKSGMRRYAGDWRPPTTSVASWATCFPVCGWEGTPDGCCAPTTTSVTG